MFVFKCTGVKHTLRIIMYYGEYSICALSYCERHWELRPMLRPLPHRPSSFPLLLSPDDGAEGKKCRHCQGGNRGRAGGVATVSVAEAHDGRGASGTPTARL